jgi:thiol-disulfide isomerase/thioredoxin
MAKPPDVSRRHFLGAAAMTMAGLGIPVPTHGFSGAGTERQSRELAAIGRAADWLNSPRLTAPGLAGKVVVVDFCTYTCINWLRTLPYRRAWAQKYRPGLILIGVHTPEFEFEKNLDNVRRAVRDMRVEYPIVIDNDYAIWRAFNNQYWPALYVIDAQGRIQHRQFGEGKYVESEKVMQGLLAGAGAASDGKLVAIDATGVEVQADWDNLRSPENYTGYDRTERFASPGGVEPDRPHRYAAPPRLTLNQWALAGEWTMGRQAARSGTAGARIVSRFHARDLHLVLGPSRREKPVRFRVAIDGKPPGPAHGGDVDDAGQGTVIDQRLYQLIRQPKPIVERQFEIEFLDAGVEAFAFTFG